MGSENEEWYCSDCEKWSPARTWDCVRWAVNTEQGPAGFMPWHSCPEGHGFEGIDPHAGWDSSAARVTARQPAPTQKPE